MQTFNSFPRNTTFKGPLKYIETWCNHIQQFGRLLDNTY